MKGLASIAAVAIVGLIPTNAAGAAITSTQATTVGRSAIKQQSKGATHTKVSCPTTTTTSVTCTVAWKASGRTYSGALKLKMATTAKTYVYSYTLRATGRAKHPPAKLLHKTGKIIVTIPKGQARTNPLPLGSTATSNGWNVNVLGTTPDATAQVLAENQFNDPPAAGAQFFLATVRATHTGADSQSFGGSYRLRAVGASAVEYTTFGNSCGVIPNEITSNRVFTGGTIEGNVCWHVQSSDAASLVMFDNGPIASGAQPVYFALSP